MSDAIDKARKAVDEFRDFARMLDQFMDFKKRDQLVADIHRGLDEAEALRAQVAELRDVMKAFVPVDLLKSQLAQNLFGDQYCDFIRRTLTALGETW